MLEEFIIRHEDSIIMSVLVLSIVFMLAILALL
jgi:hypothetical protein